MLRKVLKTLLLLTLFIPAISTLAAQNHTDILKPTSTTKPRQASFYVDVGLGIDILNAATSSFMSSRFSVFGSYYDFTHNTRMINSSTAVSLGAGYVYPVNRWFNLGFRVFGRYANNFESVFAANRKTVGGGSRGRISSAFHVSLRNFEYGIDLTPSVNIGANQFLSGIFGLAFNRALLRTTTVARGQAGVGAGPSTLQNSMRHSLTGLRLGYSLEALMNQYVSVYMSYIWTGYGSIAITQSQPAPFVSNNEVNLQTHNILVGVRYYFSPQHYLHLQRSIIQAINHHCYLHLAFGSLIPQFESSNAARTFEGTPGSNDNEILINGYQGAPAPMTLLGLGYGLFIHHFYLSLEALMNVNLANIFSKSDLRTIETQGDTNFDPISETSVQIRLNTVEAALDLKLGGEIAPQTLLVARVGMSTNHIAMIHARQINYNADSTIYSFINQRIGRNVLGFRFGAGIEKLFTNNLSMAMDYIFTYYGHVFASDRVLTTNAAVFADSDANSRVTTHQIVIGVNYYFS